MADPLKQKANGIWVVDYEDPDTGKRRRISTETRDKSEARSRMRDILAGTDPRLRRLDGAPRTPADALTMAKVFDDCTRTVWSPRLVKSQATIKSNIKILNRKIGDTPPSEVTEARLLRLIDEFRGEGYAEASIKRKLDMVSRALGTLTKVGPNGERPVLAVKPVMPAIKPRNIQDRIISPAEEAAIFAAVERRRQAEPARQWWRFARLLMVLRDTAFRYGEAMSLGPASVKVTTMTPQGSDTAITVTRLVLPRYSTKSERPHEVPATASIVAEIDALNSQAVDGKWFPMSGNTVFLMWQDIRRDVGGIDDVKLHTFRHTCLTRLARGGMDIWRLQRWANHANINITADRYAKAGPDDLHGGLSILESNGP